MKSATTTNKFNLQKLFAVLITLISFVALIATEGKNGFWIFLFVAGFVWFIVIRILKD